MTELDSRTIVARTVLLDALDALAPHRGALVVVGAQAVYLRTGSADITVAAYTFDGDLVLDPTLLRNDPPLENAMTEAGFALLRHPDRPEPGTWVTHRLAGNDYIIVPVDLIVPEGFAPPGGKRSVQLGTHSKMAVRRTHGLEAALVDHSMLHVGSLDDADDRVVVVNVAGPAALLVSKLHKLHDRVGQSGREDRLRDKDAADVFRLMQVFPAESVAATLVSLRSHAVAGPVTVEALGYMPTLFGAARSRGVQMATAALQSAYPEALIRVVATSWTAELLAATNDSL